jgi:hypothetical protein
MTDYVLESVDVNFKRHGSALARRFGMETGTSSPAAKSSGGVDVDDDDDAVRGSVDIMMRAGSSSTKTAKAAETAVKISKASAAAGELEKQKQNGGVNDDIDVDVVEGADVASLSSLLWLTLLVIGGALHCAAAPLRLALLPVALNETGVRYASGDDMAAFTPGFGVGGDGLINAVSDGWRALLVLEWYIDAAFVVTAVVAVASSLRFAWQRRGRATAVGTESDDASTPASSSLLATLCGYRQPAVILLRTAALVPLDAVAIFTFSAGGDDDAAAVWRFVARVRMLKLLRLFLLPAALRRIADAYWSDRVAAPVSAFFGRVYRCLFVAFRKAAAATLRALCCVTCEASERRNRRRRRRRRSPASSAVDKQTNALDDVAKQRVADKTQKQVAEQSVEQTAAVSTAPQTIKVSHAPLRPRDASQQRQNASSSTALRSSNFRASQLSPPRGSVSAMRSSTRLSSSPAPPSLQQRASATVGRSSMLRASTMNRASQSHMSSQLRLSTSELVRCSVDVATRIASQLRRRRRADAASVSAMSSRPFKSVFKFDADDDSGDDDDDDGDDDDSDDDSQIDVDKIDKLQESGSEIDAKCDNESENDSDEDEKDEDDDDNATPPHVTGAYSKRLLVVLVVFAALTHWLACAWIGLGLHTRGAVAPAAACGGGGVVSWMDLDGLIECADGKGRYADIDGDDRCERFVIIGSATDVYLRAAYFVASALTTVGNGDIHAVNDAETCFLLFLICVSAAVFAALVATFEGAFAAADSTRAAFELRTR